MEEYITLHNGVIKQNNHKKITYDNAYVETRYNTYNVKVINMSYLRLGYIIGSIGYIPLRLLDVGYGNGGFLEISKGLVRECCGNDISNYNIPEGCEFVDNILEHGYDVITFFDSLEHFEDISFVKELKTKFVCISVPFCHNFDEEWFMNWKHRRPNEHLYHFNDKSLISFMDEMGFSIINKTNLEDIIREPVDNNINILTAIFKKR